MNSENRKFIERQIKDLEESIERFYEKINEHKLHLKDEKLYFLHNEINNSGLVDCFQLKENDIDDDEDDVIYFAYDNINPKIMYEIETTDIYELWYFRIMLNGEFEGSFTIDKKIMNFEHFIKYVVKPFIVKVKYDIKEKENKECE